MPYDEVYRQVVTAVYFLFNWRKVWCVMDLDPTYKFFTEAGIVVLVLFLLCLLIGGGLYVAYRLIRFNEKALVSQSDLHESEEKAKQSEIDLEEIRLKILSELTLQISSLTQRIADDREHDRSIRENEVQMVKKLVAGLEESNQLWGVYKRDNETVHSVLFKHSTDILEEMQQANRSIVHLTELLTTILDRWKALEKVLADLPDAVRDELMPYCQHIEKALQQVTDIPIKDKNHR